MKDRNDVLTRSQKAEAAVHVCLHIVTPNKILKKTVPAVAGVVVVVVV